MAHPRVAAVVATRPCHGETANGDGWRIDHDGPISRIAILDALGHGPIAAEITAAALGLLAARPTLGPVEAINACHAALVGTRGAALGVVRFDLAAGSLAYAAIGNIEARLSTPGGDQRLIAYRGIVGTHMRTVRAFALPLPDQWLLFMHTDGVSSRFTAETTLTPTVNEAQRTVETILTDHGRTHDDATILLSFPLPLR